MAIQMTKKEYEAKYGIAPVFSTETFDTTPAPVRMTRAEYDATYGTKDTTTSQKIGGQIKESFKAGFEKSKTGYESAVGAKNVKDLLRGSLRFGAGGIEAAFAPLAPVFAPIGKGVGAVSEKISDVPSVQKFATGKYGQKAINTAEDVLDITTIASLYPTQKITSGASVSKAGSVIDKIKKSRENSAVLKVEKELFDIENSYNQTSKKNAFTKDTGSSSRKRIAQTDVLSNLVDEDGKITYESAKSAAKRYGEQTIDGAEGVVRDLVAKEKKSVNIEQVRKSLMEEISQSRLEGSDLVTAVNGVKKELQGLKLRADELGNIPLEKIHDAKISTTKNIDYTNPLNVSYRKSIASAYKKLVENNSNVEVPVMGKKYKIKDINEKLGVYLGDIERIQSLGGKRVKGGRLGKYTAQISGNLAGAGVGGVVGGPVGMAIGTVVGGEFASKIRGKQMAGTFGKTTGKVATKDALLSSAKQQASEVAVKDLTTPDVKLGAPKGIPKTKEVFSLEKKIAKNVEDQKKAIKAGNFNLVATLKEVYNALVDKLKEMVKQYKELPKNKGFIKNPFFNDSSKAGKPQGKGKGKQIASTNSTGLDTLSQEAKKYKSAESLLKSKYPDVNFSIYENGGEINLSKIIVPKEVRNNGIGTKAMNDLIDYADNSAQKITLTPSGDYGGSKSRLIDFYKKFGFVENKGKFKDFSTRELMYRLPK